MRVAVRAAEANRCGIGLAHDQVASSTEGGGIEGATAADVRGGTQATVSQSVTKLLASVSFPTAATYAVSVSERGIAVDNHQVNQSVLDQLVEQALAGQATTGVTVVNDVDQQDRSTQVTADGSFTLKFNGEDSVIVDLTGVGSGQVEKHVLALNWLWNDGSQDRSRIQLFRFRVQRPAADLFQRGRSQRCPVLET